MRIIALLLTITVFSSVIRAQTDFQYYNLALVKYNMGNYQGAKTDLTRAIELNPSHMSAFVLRGSASYNMDDFESAITDFTRAIEIATKDAGGVRLTITDTRGNVVESRSTAKPDPHLGVAYFNRALAWHATGNYQAAIEDFGNALENDHDQISVYYNRGVSRDAYGDYQGAAEDYTSLLQIEPRLAEGYLKRGNSLHLQGETAKACSDWQRAYDLGIEEASGIIKQHCGSEHESDPQDVR